MKRIISTMLAVMLVITSLPAGNSYAFEETAVSYTEAEANDAIDEVTYGDISENDETTEDVFTKDESEVTYDADKECDENGFVWDGYKITNYLGSDADIVIPAECREIGDSAFYNDSTTISVTFEENSKCTKIGSKAFANNKSLKSVILPESISEIGINAFKSCDLSEITIPSDVTKIGDDAFSYNHNLSKVTVLSNDITIESDTYVVFRNCAISSIVWGDDVTTVPARLFSQAGFAQDMNIVIPKRFKSIGAGAFYSTSITGLTFEEKSEIAEIDAEAFYKCSKIKSVVLPESVERINGLAFAETGISEIVIPTNVSYLGTNVFKDDKSLTKVTIESNNISVNNEVFLGCAISEVNFPQNMTSIPAYLFAVGGFDSKCVITIPKTVKKIGMYAFKGTNISGVVFEEGSELTSIDAYAFGECSNIDEIILPETLEKIDRYAFTKCDLRELRIPSNVTSIGQEAFCGNTNLKKVVIDSSAEGAWSIFDLCNIKELSFGENVTAIGKDICYKSGSGFSSNCVIKIPKSVKTIGEKAFSRCGFSKVEFEEGSNLKTIEGEAFSNCENLTAITLPESLETIETSAFACCDLKEIVIPKNVKKLGYMAFATNKGLGKVTILSDVLDMPESDSGFGDTFISCAVKELILSDSMKEIPSRLFAWTGFAEGTSVVIPNSVTKIGYRSFASCGQLSDIYMGSNVTDIDDDAFKGCETTLTIHAPKDSYAITWAKKKKINYVEVAVYKVNYVLDGGLNPSENAQEYMSGAGFKFADPSKKGYTFAGWYTDKDFSEDTKITSIDKDADADITVYAKWQVNKYTIHFDANEPLTGSSTGSVADISAEYGKEYTNPSAADRYSFERYTQTGWNTEADGSGTAYSLNAVFKNLTDKNNEVVTLYAMWEGSEVVVSFDTNASKTSGGKVTFRGGDYKTAYGKTMTIPGAVPASSGSEFFGWAFDKDSDTPDITLEMLGKELDLTVRKTVEAKALENSDKVTLYAVWRSAVSKVTLSSYAETVYLGENLTLSATVLPDNAVTDKVTWKSSDARIATVSDNDDGTVTVIPVKNGNVKITATSKAQGHKSATASITVATKVTSLLIKVKGTNNRGARIQTGKTVQLEAVLNEGGSKPSNKAVIYESVNSNIATVSASGLITAKTAGIVKISARSAEDPEITSDFIVEVYNPVKSVELNAKKLNLCDGDTYQFTATVKPNTASNTKITWSVSDAEIADVSDRGLVTVHLPSGKTSATVNVKATTIDGSNKSATCKITVGAAVTDLNVNVSGKKNVFINGEVATAKGKSIKLSAGFVPANVLNKDVEWTSSEPSIATVDSKGNVKGVSAGNVTITATHKYSGKSASRIVYVYVPVTKLSLSASKLDLHAGNIFTLNATTNNGITKTDTEGFIESPKTVWTSSDENVVTVDECGAVTAKLPEGKTKATATVTAKITSDGNVTKTAKCTINVKAAEVKVSKITFANSKISMGLFGRTFLDANVSPLAADNRELSWSSSNPLVAEVRINDEGRAYVCALSEGKAKITATAKDGSGKKATCNITVGKEIVSVELTGKDRLAVGKSTTLKVKLNPSSGNKVANKKVYFASSDESVATVNSKGVVKALKPGTVTIMVSAEPRVDIANTKTAGLTITTYIPVGSVKADVKEITVCEGFEGLIPLRSISPLNATDKSFTWKSGNPDVVTVAVPGPDKNFSKEAVIDHANLTFVMYKATGGGKTTITGTANDGSGKKVTIKVTVLGNVKDGDVKIKVGKTPKGSTVTDNGTKNVTVDGLKIKGSFKVSPVLTSTASDKRVTYTSSNKGVATVDSKGKIVIKNKGTATITMRTADGGYTATVTVNVP